MRTPATRASRPWTRRALPVAVALAVVASACSGDDDDATPTTPPPSSAPESTAEPADPAYVFGLLGPGNDELAELEIAQQHGVELALADINAAGGMLGGPAGIVSVDEDAETPMGDSIDDLVTQGAAAILGPVSSTSALDLVPIVRDGGLLACSASATATSVTFGNTVTSFFRTAIRDDDTAAAVADRVMAVPDGDEPPSSVMIVGRDDTYGAELAGALAGQLTARGAAVETQLYPPRRVEFAEQVDIVVAADPDVVVVASYEEGLELLRQLSDGGFPLARIVVLDGLSMPNLATQLYPDDPTDADGIRMIRATGDRAITARLEEGAGPDDAITYGAQMYDCTVTIALAAIAADSTAPDAVGAQIQAVTSSGRECSTFAHCAELLGVGEDIHYVGTSGGLELDAAGDIQRARLTTSTIVDGELVDTATAEVDLVALGRAQLLSATIFTTQVQQGLKILGYFDGDVTGVWDDATTEALQALQRDLGVPETGVYDEATDAALRARLGSASATLELSISQLQLELQALGFYDGPIDGRYSAATIDAVRREFQASIGVPQTGILDTTTLRAIYALGQERGTPIEPPPTTTIAPTTTTTPPTTTTAPRTTTTIAPTTAPPVVTTVAPTIPPTIPPTTAPPVVTTVAPTPAPTPAPTTEAPAPPTTEAPAPPTTEAPAPPTTEAPPPAAPTMFEVLAADPDYSTFVDLLRTAGFVGDLSQPAPPFTVLAPTNAAFAAMDDAERAEWTQDPARLRSLLAYHGVDPDAGVLQPDDFRPGTLLSIQGSPLTVAVDGATVTVDGGTLGAPADASNGIVYPIDQVLVPPA